MPPRPHIALNLQTLSVWWSWCRCPRGDQPPQPLLPFPRPHCRSPSSLPPSAHLHLARPRRLVMAGFFSPQPGALQWQEPQRQQRQRHVMVPAQPTAHVVVAQPHLLFALLQQLLHPVPRPMHPGQLRPPRLVGVGKRVPRLRFLLTTLQDRQPLARPHTAVGVLGLHRCQQHLHQHRPLLAIADFHRPPTPRRLPRQPLVHPLEQRPPRLTPRPARRSPFAQVPHQRVSGPIPDVAQLPPPQGPPPPPPPPHPPLPPPPTPSPSPPAPVP